MRRSVEADEVSVVRPQGLWRQTIAACGGFMGASLAWLGLHDPLASMTSYSAALMTLNQIVPPLLLLAVSDARWQSWHKVRSATGVAAWMLDPWVAGTVFTMVSVAVSLPSVLDQALANALFSVPLGLLELIAGLLVWAQLLPATRGHPTDWKAGLFAIAVGVPMTVVAAVWMMSSHVLYAPYINVICLWNFTPLENQRWAGFAMFIAGIPLQLRGVWLLLGLSSAEPV